VNTATLINRVPREVADKLRAAETNAAVLAILDAEPQLTDLERAQLVAMVAIHRAARRNAAVLRERVVQVRR
jgi:hypothetical protein